MRGKASRSSGSPDAVHGLSRAGTVQSAARAIAVLRAVTFSPRPKHLREISDELGLHKTTILRLLRTLVGEGVIIHEKTTGRYTANPAQLVHYRSFFQPALELVKSVQRLLAHLAEQTTSTAMLILPDFAKLNTMLGLHAPPPSPVRVDPVGRSTVPLHSVAGGKCYLAFLPEDELERYMTHGQKAVTSHTITSPKRLRAELGEVRRRGYAVNRGETDLHSFGLAVPLTTTSGSVVGGLALAFATPFPTDADVTQQLESLRQASEAVSQMLSYESWRALVKAVQPEIASGPVVPEPDDPGFGDGATPIVRSAARAVRIMKLLVRSPEGLSVTEVGRRRGIDRLTALRLLRTLEVEECLWRDAPSRGYRVSPLEWIRCADVLKAGASLTGATRSILEWLAESTGVTACFICPDVTGRAAAELQYALPDRPVRFHPEYSALSPLHAIAVGKCYMAAQSKRWIAEYIEGGLTARTDKTIASREDLIRELDRVRKQGYAVSREELLPGIGSLAVPVSDGTGRVVGGLALLSPIHDLTDLNVRKRLPLLQPAASALSRLLISDWRKRLGPAQHEE